MVLLIVGVTRAEGQGRVLMNACAGKTAPDYWIEKLKDRDPDARVRAAQALGETRDSAVVPLLVHGLKDPNLDVRLAVIQALGRIGPGASGAVPALKEMLAEKNGRLRDAVSRSLENIRSADLK
jgi:HEAT repeat protein